MNVYLLIEEIDQSEFVRKNEFADPVSLVVGVYGDKDKAEREKIRLSKANAADVERFHTDKCIYLIEERPIL